MIYLVSPDCILYVINDTNPNGPDVQQLRQLRNDVPPPKNFNQLIGWTTGPHVGRGKAGNWQHLRRWTESEASARALASRNVQAAPKGAVCLAGCQVDRG